MLDARMGGKKTSFNAEQQNIPDVLCTMATKIMSIGKTRNMKSNPNASFLGRRHRHTATWMHRLIINIKKPVIRIEKDILKFKIIIHHKGRRHRVSLFERIRGFVSTRILITLNLLLISANTFRLL